MNRKELLSKIILAAKRDARNRRDPRYLQTMGFLTAKGLLNTNQIIPLLPNKHVQLVDAIWAGENVEPRILEVLPAAVIRFPKHFDLEADRHPELFETLGRMKRGELRGPPLWGIDYEKLILWVGLPLRDRRLKPVHEKKITKTFRLKPEVIRKIRTLAAKLGCSETEALERTVLG